MRRLWAYAIDYLLSFLPWVGSHHTIQKNVWDDEYRSLVILGNGPALGDYIKGLDTPEAGSDYMAVNFFGKNEAFVFFKPRHYVVFDPVLFEGIGSEESLGRSLLIDINEKVSWPMNFYIPMRFLRYRERIEQYLGSQNIKVVYFRDAGFLFSGGWFSRKLMSLQLVMPKAQNVLVAAIYISILLGYKKIFIEGADHSWHKYLLLSPDNKLMIKDVHFYDGNPKLTPLLKDAKSGTHFSMKEIFFAYYQVHKGYECLRRFADSEGTCVINRSLDSFIDAFDKSE